MTKVLNILKMILMNLVSKIKVYESKFIILFIKKIIIFAISL